MTHDIVTPLGTPRFLTLSGSRLYGIDTPESDYDYVGALIEPAEYSLGLKQFRDQSTPQQGFEQCTFKGLNYEGSIYSLRKLVRMFADGNPTVLCLMFSDPIVDEFGICHDSFRSMVASKRSGHRFMRYMEAQRKSMIGQRAKHVKRQELIDAHGFDTKFAAHVIRLGYQGVEFLRTGQITLPMSDREREIVLSVRRGEVHEDRVLAMSDVLFQDIETALAETWLPDTCDSKAIDRWLVSRYLNEYLD